MFDKPNVDRILAIRPFSLPFQIRPLRIPSNEALFHVGFWLCFYLSNSLLEGSFLHDFYLGFYGGLLILPLQMTIVYVNVYFLLPKSIPNKKYAHYILSIVVMLALVVLIKRYLIFDFIYPAANPFQYNTESQFAFSNYFLMLNSELCLIWLTAAMKMAVEWAKNIQSAQTLEKEKLAAELGLLKAQIQPHFFFNTLNNVYALTLKKSDQAPEVVQKLSELMSYLLYDCDKATVALEDELRLIRHYVDLEKLRWGKRLDVALQLEGNFYDKEIPPFLILPFVENAFKHGQNHLSKVLISISVRVQGEKLYLKVKNSIAAQVQPNTGVKGGIGLKNVQRRLALLFGTDYRCTAEQNAHEYWISLSIPLCFGTAALPKI